MTKIIKYIDLFCGIGGFRIGIETACKERAIESMCTFSCDIDIDARKAYEANFGETPYGDITEIDALDIPNHDILLAGFPCQPFSICGDSKGFDDIRGTLFFDIARILEAKRPRAFVLENVKQLRSHGGGRTLSKIISTLSNLGYSTNHKVLNALDFGLPQKRERIFIVGFLKKNNFNWKSDKIPMTPLSAILESEVPSFYYASEKIRKNRLERTIGKPKIDEITIWHENKGGNIGIHPYSCALRAGASYNYLLVNGERRLTEREMLRLQGFPDNYKIVCGYGATRKQAGNSIPVPCVTSVVGSVLDALSNSNHSRKEEDMPSFKQLSSVS